MGAGQFGTKAVEKLLRKYPGAILTVVDQNQGALDRLGDFVVERVCEEAASFLDECLQV